MPDTPSTHQDSPKVPGIEPCLGCSQCKPGLFVLLVDAILATLPTDSAEWQRDSFRPIAEKYARAVLPVFFSALLSDEVVEALAQRRAEYEREDLEKFEAHLAKHGREDEGFRAEARADLQAAIKQVGGG